jgi:apolipoprotein N-acyltransferase
VVGTELTPYPKIFVPIDDKLGGVMGRCIGQEEISCLHYRQIPFGCAVCYESVYGEYCTGYVRKGARFLTVITNDAWWGDTPGYRQHFSYSRLRAIETRREIARCANTGISAFIDQRGEVISKGPWWEPAVLSGVVNLSSRITFFVRHGDLVGLACVILTLALAVLWLALAVTGRKISRKK